VLSAKSIITITAPSAVGVWLHWNLGSRLLTCFLALGPLPSTLPTQRTQYTRCCDTLTRAGIGHFFWDSFSGSVQFTSFSSPRLPLTQLSPFLTFSTSIRNINIIFGLDFRPSACLRLATLPLGSSHSGMQALAVPFLPADPLVRNITGSNPNPNFSPSPSSSPSPRSQHPP
jgi:hypothetical protein